MLWADTHSLPALPGTSQGKVAVAAGMAPEPAVPAALVPPVAGLAPPVAAPDLRLATG